MTLLMLLANLIYATSLVDISVIDKDAAPLLTSNSASDKVIPNSYIVVYKDHVDSNLAEDHQAWITSEHHNSMKKRDQTVFNADGMFNDGILHDIWDSITGVQHTFDLGDFKGYSGSFNSDVLHKIRMHPDVKFVEADSLVHTQRPIDDTPSNATTQRNAPWGLARISHRGMLTFGTFNKFEYDERGGEGVTAYVIDTGINVKHVDFDGRAKWGKTIPVGDEDEDGNGHGSHCAGTVAGKKYGVAKKANVVAVKVLRSNGSGSMSDVIKGVEYAVEDHLRALQKAKKENKRYKGATANMSLGGGKSPSLDMAVNAAVDAGVHFAVAAGNDNADACKYSPAAANKPVTVGASTIGDERAYFSNIGKCVDIFAPGLNIQSIWTGSDDAVNTISGTSMASPHVCGLMTYILSLQPDRSSGFYTPMTPKKLKNLLLSIATRNSLVNLEEDTVNLLAFNGGGEDISFDDEHSLADDANEMYSMMTNVMSEMKNKMANALEMTMQYIDSHQ